MKRITKIFLLIWTAIFLLWPTFYLGAAPCSSSSITQTLRLQQAENAMSAASCASDFRNSKPSTLKIQNPLVFKKHRTVYHAMTENLRAVRAAAFATDNELSYNTPRICPKFPLSEHTREG